MANILVMSDHGNPSRPETFKQYRYGMFFLFRIRLLQGGLVFMDIFPTPSRIIQSQVALWNLSIPPRSDADNANVTLPVA